MDAPVDVTKVHLETPRLLLRPWEEEDLEDFFAYASVDDVGPMAGWRPHENREVSRGILRRFIDEKKTLALVLKESGHVIGSIGLERLERSEDPAPDRLGREIGYVLAKDYWGRGLMPEAVKEERNPRRRSGACSIASAAAPGDSPPADSPCSKRRKTNRIGAAIPIWL